MDHHTSLRTRRSGFESWSGYLKSPVVSEPRTERTREVSGQHCHDSAYSGSTLRARKNSRIAHGHLVILHMLVPRPERARDVAIFVLPKVWRRTAGGVDHVDFSSAPGIGRAEAAGALGNQH